MKHWIAVLIILILTFLGVGAVEVENPDKPAKGAWDFGMQKVMELNAAGEEPFGGIYQFGVGKAGTLYLHDNKKDINYIFDGEGKFIKSFGPKGEGPGEVRRFFGMHVVDDAVIIPDAGRIHYFRADGSYEKTVVHDTMARPPVLFLNKNEFISAPPTVMRLPDNKGNISRFNLETGEETVITEFSVFKGGIARTQRGTMVLLVRGLTPLMTVGRGAGRLYYGMSDRYEINMMDMKGKALGSFSLDRGARKLAPDVKKGIFKRSRQPEAAIKKIIDSLPDVMTFFHRIQVIGNLVYVFEANVGREQSRQTVDIFSLEGKYLYRGVFDFGEDVVYIHPGVNVKIIGNFLYAALESPGGDIRFVKYKIRFPH